MNEFQLAEELERKRAACWMRGFQAGADSARRECAGIARNVSMDAMDKLGYVSGNMGFENGRAKAAAEIANRIQALPVSPEPMFFCSCGGALTKAEYERHVKMGHDQGESILHEIENDPKRKEGRWIHSEVDNE